MKRSSKPPKKDHPKGRKAPPPRSDERSGARSGPASSQSGERTSARKDDYKGRRKEAGSPESRKPESRGAAFRKSEPRGPESRRAEPRKGEPRRSDTRRTEPRTARPDRAAPARERPRSPRPEVKHASGPRPNLFGAHAVREAWLNPKRSIHALYLTPEAEKTFASWPSPRVARPVPVIVDKDTLDRMLGRRSERSGDSAPVHQGFALSAAPLEEVFVQDLISTGLAQPHSVVLMLDQVTDPHNVGAILRSACAFGAHGVIMQKRHAPELEGVLCKTASGAVEHLPVCYETNLSRALDELKESGYVVVGLDEHAPTALGALDIPPRCVFVLGNEGEGMRRLIREHCDHLVTLPTQKPINSLNVSNAAAVALYALNAR